MMSFTRPESAVLSHISKKQWFIGPTTLGLWVWAYMKDSPWQEHKILGHKSRSGNVKRFTNSYPNDALGFQNIPWLLGSLSGRIYERDRIWSRIWKMWKVENVAPKIQTIARFDDPVSYAENLDGVSYTSSIDRGSEGMNEWMKKWMFFCGLLSLSSFTSLPEMIKLIDCSH